MPGDVLVTGAGGFVGRHLSASLGERCAPLEADVTDRVAVRAAVAGRRPAAVVHLAAASSVASSWEDADHVWRVNALGTVNVLDAILAEAPRARVLVVSSGEVYGDTGGDAAGEARTTAPRSPYAASKAAAEIACERARRVDGLDAIVVRPFTHIGPGQAETFAVASWAHQIARLEVRGGGVLNVGDVDVRRDLLDVRDVCGAYLALVELDAAAPVYNVATGAPVRLGDVVRQLVELARAPVQVRPDERRLRRADLRVLSGDPALLARDTAWRPKYSLAETLTEMLAAARAAVVAEVPVP